jgi:hypothetical protein
MKAATPHAVFHENRNGLAICHCVEMGIIADTFRQAKTETLLVPARPSMKVVPIIDGLMSGGPRTPLSKLQLDNDNRV